MMRDDKKLIVDIAILFESLEKEGSFFFAPRGFHALMQFQKQGYGIILITSTNKGMSEKQKKLLSWGKKFLLRENIPVSFSAKSSFKKLVNPVTTVWALSLSTLYFFFPKISPKSKKKSFNKPVFLYQSPNLDQPEFLHSQSWDRVIQEILHPPRRAVVERKTKETHVIVRIDLDGSGKGKIKTGLGFFDHMLTNFSKHSGIDLIITVKGDLEVDEHHTIEDTALALGECIRKALGNKRGLERYGFVLPMDESESSCSIDLSGRSHLEWDCIPFQREYVGDFPTEMLKHFYNSLCLAAGMNMNMKITGENEHHLIESSFKSLARSLRQALKVTHNDIPSTKGSL